ncbi:MAG: family 16 glycoside hydrolase [Gemmataceae bacterium]
MSRPLPVVLLASLLPGPAISQAPPVKAQDERQVQAYLDKAKQAFETEMKRYRQEVNKLLDQERETAKKEADAKRFNALVERIRQQKADFADNGTVPDSLKVKLKDVKNLVLPTEAASKLEKAYEEAIAGYGKLNMDKKADALKVEFERRKQNGELLGLESGWVPLFNGKDLTGWERTNKAVWEVKDGVLIGSGDDGLLKTKREDYGNFKLRLEAKIDDGGNSGVFFRNTRFATYEAQIEGSQKGKGDVHKTGSLLSMLTGKGFKALVLVDEPTHKSAEWFAMTVVVEGTRTNVTVKGKVVSEFDDKDRLFPLKGAIALQQHHAGPTVSFRNIEILELPAKK